MTKKQNYFKFKDGKPVGVVIYSYGKNNNEKRFYKQKSTYDEENSTIRMCEKDWKKFKKELGFE